MNNKCFAFFLLISFCNNFLQGMILNANAQIIPDNTLGNENSRVTPIQDIRGIPSK